ncbi:DMT family transporter [Leptolyngbya sp. AN02str]|uniref:DMT family transporter n=1 Tax=Leptolyngbya sp. AN02str TaxID=3423363 RepID=UPI003D311A93
MTIKSTESNRAQFSAILALAGLAIVWGYNWVVMKIAVRDAPPFDFAAMRTLFGALSLFGVMIALRKPLKPVAIPETALFGILQVTGTIGLITWALVNGGAGKTAVLNYTMPFWALLLAWAFLKERPQGKQWWSLALSLAGLVMILVPFTLSDDLASKGMAVGAGICWAISSIVAKRLNQRTRVDLLSFTAWQMLFGSLPLLLIAWLAPAPPVMWTPSFIAALVYNVIPGGAIAWLLWVYALNNLSTGSASLGTLAIPVVGVLAAWLQLGEVPTGLEFLGMVLIVGALILNSLAAVQKREAPTQPSVR